MMLAVVAVVAVGCSSTEDTSAAPTTKAAATTTRPASPSSTSNANAPMPAGEEITLGGDNGGLTARVTMFSVTQEVAPQAPRPTSGGHWAAIDVQTCVDASTTPFTVSWNNWAVADAKNGNYPASNLTYGQFPKPIYPFSSQPVAVGDCVRGAILFPVPDGVTVTKVKYTPNPRIVATWLAS
jgi:hypothetical protein